MSDAAPETAVEALAVEERPAAVRVDYAARQIVLDIREGYGDGTVDGVAVDPHTERRRLHEQLDRCLNEIVRRDEERLAAAARREH